MRLLLIPVCSWFWKGHFSSCQPFMLINPPSIRYVNWCSQWDSEHASYSIEVWCAAVKCTTFKHTYRMKTFCLLKSIRRRDFTGCWTYVLCKATTNILNTKSAYPGHLGYPVHPWTEDLSMSDWKRERMWAWWWQRLWKKKWRYFHSHTMQSKSVCS